VEVPVSAWFSAQVVQTGRLPLFCFFVAFVCGFLGVRMSVRLIRARVRWWPGNLTTGSVHVHHMVFGVVLMAAGGIAGLAAPTHALNWRSAAAAAFGLGMALVFDEFALILHLRDVYWTEQGRASVDAVFLAVAVLGLILTGVAPFGVNDVVPADESVSPWQYVWAVTFNGALVLLTLLKGKIWTGLLAIFVPLLGLVGAIRLARPTSPWARWRYRPDSRKLTRARRRDDQQRRRWVRWRNRVQDAVAGRPS